MAKQLPYEGSCPVENVINVFGGKWKSSIVFHLEKTRTLRFNALRKCIPEVTQRMLTQQLRALERDGIVHREYYPEIPPRVEYSLTAVGLSLGPLSQIMEKWGERNMDTVYKSRQRYDRKNE